MTSKTASELSSSGSAKGSISSSGGAMQGAKPATEEALPRRQRSGRGGSSSSWLALEDALKIFQEDLKVLQALGVPVQVVPEVSACGCPAVVLPNVVFVDGNFLPVDVQAEARDA